MVENIMLFESMVFSEQIVDQNLWS